MSKLLLQHLHSAQLIDQVQLGQVLRRMEQWGGDVVVILLQERMVEEQRLVETLAAHFGLPWSLPLPMLIESQALALLDPNYCSQRLVIPLALEDDGATLRLAIADPSNIELLDEIRARVGCRIRPVVSGALAIQEALQIHFHGADPGKETIPGPLMRNATPARAPLNRNALQAGADDSGEASLLPPMVDVHEVIHSVGPPETETWHQAGATSESPVDSGPTVSVDAPSAASVNAPGSPTETQDPSRTLLMELQLRQAALEAEFARLRETLLAKGIISADDRSDEDS